MEPPPVALAIGLLLLLLSVAIGDEYVYARTIYVSNKLSSVHNESCWEGQIDKPCATLALGLKGVQNYTKLIIEPGNYTLEGNEGNFILLHNVTIMGDDGAVTVVCNDSQSAGLSFEYSRDITISGIIFDECKQCKNTTSSALNDTFMETNVSLYFFYCENVLLDSVTVRNIQLGVGVIMYNLVGNIAIEYCTIESCGNGGLYIEYSYCVPDTFNDTTSGISCLQYEESNVVEYYTKNGMFTIKNSMFFGNNGSLPSNLSNIDAFTIPHKQKHNAFGRGGGVSVFFKGYSTHNDILITNCNFTNNTALWGGGIFAEFQDSVTNTSFTVHSSIIRSNKVEIGGPTNDSKRNVGTGGGGSRVGFIYFDDFNYAFNNSIVFNNCTFESNEAYLGGGISLYSARQPLRKYGYNNFSIINCHFDHNRGRIGSGVVLFIWHASKTGAVLAPVIDSCTFTNNQYFVGNGSLIGIGAVYVDTLHARFYGSNTFENNSGSALAVTGGYITMMKDCSTRFIGNTGRNGGGIVLLGNTYILMSSNSSLEFINNTAKYHGGAIYFFSSGERDLLSSTNCFIRYENVSLTPNEWNSSFTFEDNKLVGGKNNSIYTSSVLPCLWGGAFGNASVNSSHDSVFCWDKWEYFSENVSVDCATQIDSAAFHFTNNYNTVLQKKQIPGKVPINLRDLLQVQNEQGQSVTNSSIFIASIVSSETSNNYLLGKNKSISYMYITHEELYLYANKEGSVDVQLETLDPTVVQKRITISFQKCPAGFTLKDYNCVCLENDDYNEFVVCNQRSYSSVLLKGQWLGTCPNDTNFFCVGETPFLSRFNQSHSSNPYIDLANFTNTDNICKLVHRNGTLCGDCLLGYCMNEKMECVDNSSTLNAKLHIPGWVLYIISEFVPVTIFFFVVFVFSVTVTSRPLNSFIFFAQVITTSVNVEADGMIPISYWLKPAFKYFIRYAYHIPYDLWNLDFKSAIPVSVCLGRHGSGLLWLSLGYITALYPLLLLIILIVCLMLYNRGTRFIVCIFRPFHNCCSRLRRYTGLRQSIAGGVAIFIIISYTKFARISNQLLSSTLLRGHGFKGERVFYFDGTKAFPAEGVVYVILACVVLSTFIAIPPILLAYPTVLDIVRKVFIKDRVNLHQLYPNHKVQVFLNEFHGCYKDGSTGGIDCRWFASLYFCLRIILFTMNAQTPDWMNQYLAQTILFIVIACMFAVIRPYRRDWINSLDTLMFANLAIISAFEMFFFRDAKVRHTPSIATLALQLILVFLPLVYCVGFYVKLVAFPLGSQCFKAVVTHYKRKAICL